MRRLLIVIVALMAMAAVACGGDAEETPTPTPTTEPEAVAVDTSTTADAETEEPVTQMQPGQVPASDAPQGGVFRRMWSDPPTLDPALVTDTTSAGVVVEVFSGLVALDTDLKLIPDVAERWDVSPDGLQYTFYLRPYATFHDGKPIKAQDFKWSIERAAHPDTGSPVADTYLNDIIGVEDVLEGRATDISGVKVVDEHTLQIDIDAPKAYFLAKLTYPTAYVLDRDNVEEGGRLWTDTPNGSGPFKLKEYTVGERIVLERNENFYRTPPNVDTILMNLAGGQSMAMYENDEIDIVGVGLFDLERVSDPNEELNKELVIAPPSFSVSYIGFNATMHPFKDPKFRQALNHAIDKELIATEVLSDLVVPAYGVLPPGFPAYNKDLEGLRHDRELAQQLLSESAYPTLPPEDQRIVITVPGTGGTIGLYLEVIIEMWREVLGVEVEVQQVEWATYLDDLHDGKFQAFAGLGWEADYPDPQDFLDILFHTDSGINHGLYSNKEVDKILEEARIETDVARRVELYRQAEEMIVADAAWVPLWFTGEQHFLIKGHIQDFKPTPMIIPKLREIYIQ